MTNRINGTPELQKGDILSVIAGGNIISDIIGFFCKSYCHTCVVINPMEVIEAIDTGVRISPISKYTNYTVSRFKVITPLQIDQATAWMISQQGDHYNFGAVALLALKKVFGWIPAVDNRFWQDHWYCTELADEGYLRANNIMIPGIDTDEVEPEMVPSSPTLTRTMEVRGGLVTVIY